MENNTLVSDSERTVAINALQNATEDGRLSSHEFESRVGKVLAARTLTEVNGLLTDLPACLEPREIQTLSTITPTPPATTLERVAAQDSTPVVAKSAPVVAKSAPVVRRSRERIKKRTNSKCYVRRRGIYSVI